MASIKRNLVYSFVWSCGQVLIPLLSIPYVSRMLDPEGIGRVGFIDSFTYYFITIAEFGVTVYGIREIAKVKDNREKLNTLVSELITLHVISSLCVLILYAISVFFLWSRIGDIRLLLFSLSFIIVNSFTCDWYFFGTERFGYITIRSLTVRLFGLASIFLLIKQPADYYIYYALIAGSGIVSSLWNNVILFREVRFSFRKVNWTRHLRYVWVTYLLSLFYSVPLMLDVVLLRLVNTASAVGLYAFSVKIVRTGAALLTDSFLVFFPRIVSLLKENDGGQLQQKLLLNIRFVILLSVPMAVGLWLLADEVTMVFFGDKFLPVADNLRLLSVFPFLKGVSLFLSNPILIAHNKEKAFLRNLTMGTLLFIVTTLLLGFYYSDTGVCIALVIVEIFITTTNYLSVKRILPGVKVFDYKTMGHALLGSVLFIPFIYFIKGEVNSDFSKLVISIAGCFCLYILFLFFCCQEQFCITGQRLCF